MFDSRVDHTAPTLVVHSNGYIRAGGELYVEATDRSGIPPVELFADGTVIDSAIGSPALLHWDSAAVDGTAALAVRARDIAGNVAEYRRTVLVDNAATVYRTVTLDNHAPAVKFAKAPKNKTRVTKTFAVTAKATDRYGITRVQLVVNGKVVATDSKAGYRFTVNPKKYGKTFTVHLRAYDRAGNLKNSSKRTYRR
ncbi:Ig-like domain-containing protein [Actinoplanes sp. NPDC049599]|uniref:Ig-like domain-containing protein n=1 Tax=Actinoplanes sp. NPDC049599 TaxID=3363903 RepID=UPI003790E3D7